MNSFLDKHRDQVSAVLSCPDRIILKGYLPLGYVAGMEWFLDSHGVLIRDFARFVRQQFDRLKLHAQQRAADAGVPYRPLQGHERKDELARAIARARRIREGLVCVFSVVEPCQSFKVVPGKRRPRLVTARRKCLFLYYYLLHPELGFIHVRIQTWFPFTIQVYVNGHEWLARRLDADGLDYTRSGNAFTWLADPQRTQVLADAFSDRCWLLDLHELASEVNPLLNDLLRNLQYHWVIDQAEYATDLLFRDRKALQTIFPRLLRHAAVAFSAEDILRFFGHRRVRRWAAHDTSDVKRTVHGARIKHRLHGNWLKMYDKQGSVLRIETVINHPRHFRIRRVGMRQGKPVDGWFPMAKRVTNLHRYTKIAGAANQRYLDALAAVDNPAQAQVTMQKVAQPVAHRGRRVRGLNPAAKDEAAIFRAVLRGEHSIQGLRNADLRRALALDSSRTASAWTSRVLRRLHAHGLLAKVPRSRRWRPTKAGLAYMALTIRLHDSDLLSLQEDAAA